MSLLDDSFLVGLAADILDDHDFRADIDHFAIFGLCGECQRSADTSDGIAGGKASGEEEA